MKQRHARLPNAMSEKSPIYGMKSKLRGAPPMSSQSLKRASTPVTRQRRRGDLKTKQQLSVAPDQCHWADTPALPSDCSLEDDTPPLLAESTDLLFPVHHRGPGSTSPGSLVIAENQADTPANPLALLSSAHLETTLPACCQRVRTPRLLATTVNLGRLFYGTTPPFRCPSRWPRKKTT